MPLVKSHRINFSDVSLSDMRVNDNGGKSIYVNYQKGMFKMQTPVMSMPYNMGCYDPDAYNSDPSNQFENPNKSSCKYCKYISIVNRVS